MSDEPRCITSIKSGHALSPYFDDKAWLTRALGVAMLFVASPLIMLTVAVVRLTSRGPGLYRQPRTGRHGKEFVMYKIRTMYNDAESVTGPVWCAPQDSRITPVGKILRLLHLDELPQLINVARGEMDLIGPRPERPAFVARLSREISNYQARLQVLPGVTGLAQINLPPDQTLDCVRTKLLLDCAYINEASLLLDMRILLCTFLRMIGIRRGRAAHWLGVSRKVQLPLKRSDEFALVAPNCDNSIHQHAEPSRVNGYTTDLALITKHGNMVESFELSDDESADLASLREATR